MDGNQSTTSSTQDLSLEDQKRMSQPSLKTTALAPEDEAFLNLVVVKVEAGEINLMMPSSLINEAVYNALSEEQKGHVDYDAVNLTTQLRNIYKLWTSTRTATYEIENLVHTVRLTKERLEGISGDVYVI